MNIYCTAQHFGYGPTSNLFTIMRCFKRRVNDENLLLLVKTPSTEIFHKLNNDVFDMLVPEIDLEKVDLIISSFDSESVLLGWLYDYPTIYICNLFWLWDSHSNPKKILDIKARFVELKEKNKREEVFTEYYKLRQKSPHDAIFLGYLLAEHCFIRDFPQFEKYMKPFFDQISHTKTNFFMPLVEIKNPENRKKIFFQLSGSLMPFLETEEHLPYVNVVFKLAKNLAENFPYIDFDFCVNPLLLPAIKDQPKPKNLHAIHSLSQSENISLMRSSMVLFTPPGLECIAEATYLNCPLFILPEQNISQLGNIRLLQKSKFNVETFLLEEHFRLNSINAKEADARHLIQNLDDMLNDSKPYFNNLFQQAVQLIMNLHESNYKKMYLKIQKSAFETHIGRPTFSFGEIVTDYIISCY